MEIHRQNSQPGAEEATGKAPGRRGHHQGERQKV